MNENFIFISAGEASGDLHAANLIRKLQNNDSQLQFIGLGGNQMQQAGCQIIVDNRKLAVVGVLEIIKHLKDILKAAASVKKAIRHYAPKRVILIDYPGFNLRLARFCKKLGMQVIYYIPPQLWAWHESRIRWLKKYVDHIAVIYPFEVEFYQKHGVRAYYVGNPLLHKTKVNTTRTEWCQNYNLDPACPIVGLAPGSRLGEIERIFSVLLESASLLQKKISHVQFVIPVAPSLTLDDLKLTKEKYGHLNIMFIDHQHQELFHHCDLMIAVSGTVTVEIGLAQTPCLVIYKVSPLTYWLGKKLVKINYMSLINLILNRLIFPEFLQEMAEPTIIANQAETLLTDRLASGKIIEGLIEFRTQLENFPKTDIVELLAMN